MTSPTVRLPVCVGETVGGADEKPVVHLVHCRRQRKLVAFASCADCERLRSVVKEAPTSPLFVECDLGADAPVPSVDAARAANTEPIGTILRHHFATSREDATWSEVEEALLDDDNRALTVVDERGHPEGTLSTSNLLGPALEDQAEVGMPSGVDFPAHAEATPATLTASDLMTRSWEALPSSATIALATAVFAMSDVSELPVIDEEGKVEGVVAARDVLRWFAEKMGHQVGRR